MNVRISKNLKGKIVIPTLSTRSIDANTSFVITEEQFWNKDIQQAFSKRLLVVDSGLPKATPSVKKITNTSKFPVSLPGHGVLKPRQSISVQEDLLGTEDFKRLLDARILREEGKAVPKVGKAKPEKEIDSPTNDWKAVIIDPTDDGESRTRSVEPRTRNGKKPTEKNKQGAVRAGEESIVIDPRAKSSSDDDDEDSDIIFVDREQQKERLKEHPVLGKKKGKKTK